MIYKKKNFIGTKEIDGITFKLFEQDGKLILENTSLRYANWAERLKGFTFVSNEFFKHKIGSHPTDKVIEDLLKENQEVSSHSSTH